MGRLPLAMGVEKVLHGGTPNMAVVIHYGRSDLLSAVFLVWRGPLSISEK